MIEPFLTLLSAQLRDLTPDKVDKFQQNRVAEPNRIISNKLSIEEEKNTSEEEDRKDRIETLEDKLTEF